MVRNVSTSAQYSIVDGAGPFGRHAPAVLAAATTSAAHDESQQQFVSHSSAVKSHTQPQSNLEHDLRVGNRMIMYSIGIREHRRLLASAGGTITPTGNRGRAFLNLRAQHSVTTYDASPEMQVQPGGALPSWSLLLGTFVQSIVVAAEVASTARASSAGSCMRQCANAGRVLGNAHVERLRGGVDAVTRAHHRTAVRRGREQ